MGGWVFEGPTSIDASLCVGVHVWSIVAEPRDNVFESACMGGRRACQKAHWREHKKMCKLCKREYKSFKKGKNKPDDLLATVMDSSIRCQRAKIKGE